MKKKLFKTDTQQLKKGVKAGGGAIGIEKVSAADIAVVGAAARLPLAEDIDAFQDNIEGGMDCITFPPARRVEDVEKYLAFKGKSMEHRAFFEAAYLQDIDKFDHLFFKISQKEAALMDPSQRLFLETAWHALEDGGYAGETLKGSRTGIFLGYPAQSGYYNWVKDLEPSLAAMAIPGNIPSIIAARLSYLLDLKGPAMLIDTACSSSLTAVHLACRSLRQQECDLAIVGGININLIPLYDTREERPEIISSTGRTRAFDDNSDGTGIGEGCIALLLKPLNKAVRERDHIYALLKGSAVNQDGTSIGITAPNALSQEEVLAAAWKDAGIKPEQISYIEAHGTGTNLGDPIEMEALARAFGRFTQKKQFCPVGSVKTNIGHLDSAAGIAGLLKTILALSRKRIPPHLHFENPNRKINFEESPLYVNTRSARWQTREGMPRTAGVSSFGLSGTNCHVVVQEAPAGDRSGGKLTESTAKPGEVCYLLPVSARTPGALSRLIKAYNKRIAAAPGSELPHICHSAAAGRGHYNHRLALVARSSGELKKRLDKIAGQDFETDEAQGIFYGEYRVVPEGSENANPQKGKYTERQLEELSSRAAARLAEESGTSGDKGALLTRAARWYVQGAALQWEKLYSGRQYRKVRLPLYPFEKKRCWVQIPGTHSDADPETAPGTGAGIAAENQTPTGMTAAAAPRAVIVPAQTTMEKKTKIKENRKEGILKGLKEFIARAYQMDITDIGIDVNFFELGIDSISILQLKQEVMDRYGLDISVNRFYWEITTLQQLSGLIDETLPPEAESVSPDPPTLPTLSADEPPGGAAVGSMEQIIQAQLKIMEQQLQVLKGTPARVPAAETQPPPAGEEDDKTKKKNRFFQRFIVKSDQVLTPGQEAFLRAFIKRYNKRTQKSKAAAQQGRKTWANERFVQGYSDTWKELVYPVMAKEALGSRMWDIDGNQYIDFAMGFGVLLLGYNHPAVREAVREHTEKNIIVGPVTALPIEVSQLITELTGMDRVSFHNSGTEAVMTAVRLARAAAGRDKIVLFNGSYHGDFDGVYLQQDRLAGNLKSKPLSPGTPQKMVDDAVVLEYGDPGALEIIREHADQLAAVLVEPVQSRRPQLQPKEFLHQLRKITRQSGTALIFDEVITGFRLHPGGAQAFFDVDADLAAYGKVVAGGLPIGIVAGKNRFMARVDGGAWTFGGDSAPNPDMIHCGGTFSCHPLAMAASRAILLYLKENRRWLYENLNSRTAELADELNRFFIKAAVPIEMVHCASIFNFKPKGDILFLRFLFYLLAERGIYLWEGATCFISAAHSDEEIDYFKEAIKESCYEIARSGCFNINKDKIELDGPLTFPPAPENPWEAAAKDLFKVPLTGEQLRLWMLAGIDRTAAAAYNEHSVVPLRGKLDIPAMKRVIQGLVQRHDALRTISIDGKFQYVRRKMEPEVPVTVLEKGDKTGVRLWLEKEIGRPFDLSGGALLRFHILRAGEEQFFVLLVIHHIIADGWSITLLMQELIALYLSELKGIPSRLPGAVPFKAYVRWLEEQCGGQRGEAAEAFWMQEYAEPVPRLELPGAAFGSAAGSGGGLQNIKLEKDFSALLKDFSKKQGTTLFMTLLAAYYAFLCRVTDREQIVVGIPFSGQLQMEAGPLVGQCVNMLPVIQRVDEEAAFSELLNRVKDKIRQVVRHQNFSYTRLIDRMSEADTRLPDIEVAFNMDPGPGEMPELPGLVIDKHILPEHEAVNKYKLFLDIVEESDGLLVRFEYDRGAIEDEIISAWLKYYRHMLKDILQRPGARIHDIRLQEEEDLR